MENMAISFDNILNGDLEFWLIRAGRIVLILIVAFILVRIVRRVVRRLANRMARRQEERRKEQETDTDERWDLLKDKLMDVLPTGEKSERAAQRARTLGHTVASICAVIIYAVAIMVCLAELEINLAPIIAGAGIAGVALGFGAQSLVRDFLSGVFIIIEDQYGVGDVVDVGEATGVVEGVSLRVTRVRALDGTLWHVPNGEIRRSGNKSQYWARVIMDVPVAYDADITAASALIKQVADEFWHEGEDSVVLEEPEVLGVQDFGADSIAIRLMLKTLPALQWGVARELRARLKVAFDREGFEIPFPQRTVWLHDKRNVEIQPSNSLKGVPQE